MSLDFAAINPAAALAHAAAETGEPRTSPPGRSTSWWAAA